MAGAPETDPSFEALVDYLRRTRGFDFSGYKRPTLIRRVQKRLEELKLAGFNEYLDYLEVHAAEYEVLFNTILINVTSFFRDPPAWGYLAEDIIPRIVENAGPAGIRIWSVGCASGEEAYTLAILFAEAMGEPDYRNRVKIYATDLDEQALAQARTGTYSTNSLDAVPEDLRERYFESRRGTHSFRSDLRHSVIFGRHDLTRDAPISRLDLVVCRNTLMYFNSEAQATIVRRLRFGLNTHGYLFLGRAETLLAHSQLFKPVNSAFRVFTKTTETDIFRTTRVDETALPLDQPAEDMASLGLEATPVPQLMVDMGGRVVTINGSARAVLDLVPADFGRPFQDLEISYRPVDLRTPIQVATSERRTVELRGVERRRGAADSRFYDIIISPVGSRQRQLGVVISFLEVTALMELRVSLKRTSEELETAYEELQSTNEELETTNEELQSTVEELETTNEELQSTNEELETTNEELRSTNEELEAVNNRLRSRTVEAESTNAYLTSIVDGVSLGVVVVDQHRVVRTWNLVAEEMWGLRADEVVGRLFFDLDSGLPVDQLRQLFETTLAEPTSTMSDVSVDAINRRGRPVRLHVRFTPLNSDDESGVVMIIEDVDHAPAPPSPLAPK